MQRHLLSRLCSIFFLVLVCENNSQAQRSVLLEVGATYFTNDIENPMTRLSDFLALTITPRFILHSNQHSALSVDLPLSIRSRFSDETMTRFGTHLPVMVSYNFGAGASEKSTTHKFGAMAGVGMGYFYQLAKSGNGETSPYKESLSVFGPAAQFGVRFIVSKKTLFKTSENEVHPYMAIKFNYQADWKNRQHDIGALSVTMGLSF
jgi:hypothetical protein